MRIETIVTWIFTGFGLLLTGTLLYTLRITDGTFASVLAAVGVVYFCIGVASSLIHARHMEKRTRAGQE
jgi:hypothetical protein